MICRTLLLSTAYFPPAEYFGLIAQAGKVLIERHENYHKQSWRNRCTILGANGQLNLTVPVLRGSFHKTSIGQLEIDNSLRWKEQHLRSIISAYAKAPYFEFYFDSIHEAISGRYKYLLDLNMATLKTINKTLGIKTSIGWSESFNPIGESECDYRYCLSPKTGWHSENFKEQDYIQVFSDRFGFVSRLSIIDVLMNNGPGTGDLILSSLV